MAVKPVRTVVPTRAEIHPYYSITTDNRKQRITLVQVHQDQSAYMHTWGGNDTPPPVHIPLFKYRLLSSFREKPTPLVQHKLQKKPHLSFYTSLSLVSLFVPLNNAPQN